MFKSSSFSVGTALPAVSAQLIRSCSAPTVSGSGGETDTCQGGVFRRFIRGLFQRVTSYTMDNSNNANNPGYLRGYFDWMSEKISSGLGSLWSLAVKYKWEFSTLVLFLGCLVLVGLLIKKDKAEKIKTLVVQGNHTITDSDINTNDKEGITGAVENITTTTTVKPGTSYNDNNNKSKNALNVTTTTVNPRVLNTSTSTTSTSSTSTSSTSTTLGMWDVGRRRRSSGDEPGHSEILKLADKIGGILGMQVLLSSSNTTRKSLAWFDKSETYLVLNSKHPIIYSLLSAKAGSDLVERTAPTILHSAQVDRLGISSVGSN